ncbi:hypothetical protein [Caldisericum sp.]|uniref:hypothetical protein n=1 Tax=Caldisericum sp. TaxID=2499687 RepID=UPI003D110301
MLAGNPAIGATIGGTLGGAGDAASAKKKAEEEAKKQQQEQEMKMREQASSQFGSQSTLSQPQETQMPKYEGPSIGETLISGLSSAGTQIIGDVYKDQKAKEKASQAQTNNTNQSTQTATPQNPPNQQMKNSMNYLFNTSSPSNQLFGTTTNPLFTNPPTNQMGIYNEILKGLYGNY